MTNPWIILTTFTVFGAFNAINILCRDDGKKRKKNIQVMRQLEFGERKNQESEAGATEVIPFCTLRFLRRFSAGIVQRQYKIRLPREEKPIAWYG